MNKVIVITGPTASGKTSLSLALANAIQGEIVSADSMQIYRGMDIGTAKASPEEQAQVKHHMIDIISPNEDYSVAKFVNDASLCCENIISRGKIPIITGGTGLYVDSLICGREFGENDSSLKLRKILNEKYESLGGAQMLKELALFDPERASILHAADKKRIIRAFEVYYLSGETITAHDIKTKKIPPKYDSLYFITGFNSRDTLYTKINNRVDQMISSGLINEVKALLSSDLSSSCTAMQAIGYKEIVYYLNGEISLDNAIALIKQSSRKYAKRQMTWFNRKQNAVRLNWDNFNPETLGVSFAISKAKEFLA